MSWINVSILTSAEQANNVSEFILENSAISASIRDLRFRRQERINAEAARLHVLYPTKWLRSGR